MSRLTSNEARITLGWLANDWGRLNDEYDDAHLKIADVTVNEVGHPSLWVELTNGDVLEVRAIIEEGKSRE